MPSWNYRLIRRKVEEEVLVGIYEVHYDESGQPRSCTAEPVRIEVENVAWLERALEQAFLKPILDFEQIAGGGRAT